MVVESDLMSLVVNHEIVVIRKVVFAVASSGSEEYCRTRPARSRRVNTKCNVATVGEHVGEGSEIAERKPFATQAPFEVVCWDVRCGVNVRWSLLLKGGASNPVRRQLLQKEKEKWKWWKGNDVGVSTTTRQSQSPGLT